MKPLIIYTDGACRGNPGPGGWAAIIQDEGEEVILSGHENPTTNNRMELQAVIRALEWAKKEYKTERELHLFSDSALLVKSFKNGWKRKKNLDLWRDFDAVADGLKIVWTWVKGHADDPLNQRVDELAVSEAESARGKRSTSEESMNIADVAEDEFVCNKCGMVSPGLLGYMEESGMIRVDCPHCGKYIKFASPTPENLERAKKRPLITPKQIETISKKREGEGKPISANELKRLKSMTRAEAKTMLESEQTLF